MHTQQFQDPLHNNNTRTPTTLHKTHSKQVDDDTRGYILSALAKLAVHSGRPFTPEAQEVVQAALGSRNVDLQERALEAQALVGYVFFWGGGGGGGGGGG